MPQDHYLPKAYLRGFCSSVSKSGTRLYQYERNKPTPIPATPDGVAKIKNYDRVRGEKGKSVTNAIVGMEGVAIALMQRLLNGEQLELDERRCLSCYLVLQQFRVPSARESIQETFGAAIDVLMREQSSIPGKLERILETLTMPGENPHDVTAESIREHLKQDETLRVEVGLETSIHYIGILTGKLFNPAGFRTFPHRPDDGGY